MSTSLDDLITRVRRKIDEVNPQGYFSSTDLINFTNETIRRVFIPDLWEIGKFTFLGDLFVTGTLTLADSDYNDDWVDGDYSSIAGDDWTTPIYRPSLTAYVGDDTYGRIPVEWVSYDSAYNLFHWMGDPKKIVRGIRFYKGSKIIICDDDYTTLYLDAVELPTYAQYDDIELEDNIIRDALVYAVAAECLVVDKELTMENIYLREYGRSMERLKRSILDESNIPERIPRDQTGGWFGLTESTRGF